jgi:hypothetical protein
MSEFWDRIHQAIVDAGEAKTVADVMAALEANGNPDEIEGSGEQFFGGSGGDETLLDALLDAGWHLHRWQAPYYWVAREPAGEGLLTYIEGDVYARDTPDVGDPHPRKEAG